MSFVKSPAKLVTVGIPVYNESARIVDCIKSVQAQTYPNIEICISDNCSSDGTDELVRQLAEENSNIRLTRQDRNMGGLVNFGTVRRMAGGEYFMWLGADDRILPTYIEKMVAELKQYPKAAVAHSATCQVDEYGMTTAVIRYGNGYNPNNTGPLRQALQTLAPHKDVRHKKLNLYVYGLHRKRTLDRIMSQRHDPLLDGDRYLTALVALSGGFRYVDEPLYIKHVYSLTYEERWPDDPGILARQRRRNLADWHALRCVFACRAIPFWRRWYGVIIVAPFLVHRIARTLRKAVFIRVKRGLKMVLVGLGLRANRG